MGRVASSSSMRSIVAVVDFGGAVMVLRSLPAKRMAC
jgi:hypothetical protein